MACFGAPMTVAALTTLFRKRISSKWHIEWLNMLLWGGSAGLALEHIAHQEIVGTFPYLTAVAQGNTMGMLAEMATIGGTMLLACTAAWLAMVFVYSRLENSEERAMAQ